MRKICFIIILNIALLSPVLGKAQDYSFKWNGVSAQFTNGVANLVSYIDFGDINLWGFVEVALSGSYNHQNTTGMYAKRYNIGRNSGVSFYSNSSEVFAAIGPVADQWKLGDFQVNAANHLVIPIYHLTNTGNTVIVNIKGISTLEINAATIYITEPELLANNQIRDYVNISGPVAVGTNKVEPDAMFTVAGKINTRELKVNVNAGADFVFEPAYSNPDLKQLDVFIKENKRLPDIPSEDEMLKSGLEVGSFQIKLLRKIEELTLHLIKKDKEISQLIRRVKRLEQKHK